jgi:hypothetical protein
MSAALEVVLRPSKLGLGAGRGEQGGGDGDGEGGEGHHHHGHHKKRKKKRGGERSRKKKHAAERRCVIRLCMRSIAVAALSSRAREQQGTAATTQAGGHPV